MFNTAHTSLNKTHQYAGDFFIYKSHSDPNFAIKTINEALQQLNSLLVDHNFSKQPHSNRTGFGVYVPQKSESTFFLIHIMYAELLAIKDALENAFQLSATPPKSIEHR